MSFRHDGSSAVYAGDVPASSALTPSQRAEYIEELVTQLERLAEGADLARLRELLGLARAEARRQTFG